MAGLMRGAIKAVLLTGVLGSAGTGAYYYFTRPHVGELVAQQDAALPSTAMSPSDLEAVANAWTAGEPMSPAPEAEFDAPPATPEYPTDDRYAILPEAAPAPLPAEAVTRGQEPTDDLGTDEADFDPRELEALDASPADNPSSQRAREAFGDQLASAGGDRYAGPSTGLDAQASSSSVNPFEASATAAPSRPAPLPAADHAAEATPLRTANSAYPVANDAFRANPQPQAFRGTLSGGDALPLGVEGTGRPGERALEGPQKPALVIQKFAPPEIQVGSPAKFVIQVRNVGNQTANAVTIRDEIPRGTRVLSTTPRADDDGTHLVWQLGPLSTGEERTVEMQLMPLAEGEIGSVATVSYAAQASAKTRCTMPQLAIRMTAPAQVMIGQEQRVKIELRNPGTGNATNVMLFENVPEGMRHAAGPALEFEIGTLRPGETRELELRLIAERAGPVVNTLTARADGNLQVQQQVEFEVIAPELAISVDGPQRRYLERPATYLVSVENPGTAPAHDIELVTKLPKGMQFVRANNLGEYDPATHSVYWSLAQLPEGERGTVELVAMPVETGQQTLEVAGKAQQGLADEVKQDILIEGLAAIMFEVRDAEDPIEVGGETSYEIRVVNQGTKAAANVQVVVSLPPGLQAVSASGETRYSIQAGGVVFEPLAQLAPKADTLYRIQVKGIQPGDQRVTVQVNTDDISQPIRREESTRVFGDE